MGSMRRVQITEFVFLLFPGRGALLLPWEGERLSGSGIHPWVGGCPSDLQRSVGDCPPGKWNLCHPSILRRGPIGKKIARKTQPKMNCRLESGKVLAISWWDKTIPTISYNLNDQPTPLTKKAFFYLLPEASKISETLRVFLREDTLKMNAA